MNIWESRIGERYRDLVLLKHVGSYKCEFKCNCGNIKTISYYDVKKGKVTSCGHNKLAQQTQSVVGEKYNKLTAVEELDIRNGQRYYLFECDCGNRVERILKEVRRNKIGSCGCNSGNRINHGSHHCSKERLYGIHKGMLRRCFKESDLAFKYYGARGIIVCDEWNTGDIKGYYSFREWAISNGYSEELTIDRIDVNGNYEPSNCRWLDDINQARNKQITLYYTYNNKLTPLKEIAELESLNYDSLWKRLKVYNYPFEKAISFNVHKIKKN